MGAEACSTSERTSSSSRGTSRMQWAHGLTVTTTGLDKHVKDAIRQDVEAAGGRYSPNLSKRTTHLVTPEVVSKLTEKLAAAAAGPGQQRFRALQVVSKCWVSASAGLRCRADEEQFAPLLPPPAANLRCDNNTAQACQAAVVSSAAAPAAAAGSNAGAGGAQTPWVVHFSQLPDDSIYGAQQQQSSPSAARQLAHQLHLQPSPISEAFSQEQGTPAQHYPAPAHAHDNASTPGHVGHGEAGHVRHGYPGQLHADPHAHAHGAHVTSGGGYVDNGTGFSAGGAAGVSAWQLQEQARASTTPNHSWPPAAEPEPQHQHLHEYHQQQQDMQQPYQQQLQVHRAPSGHTTCYAAAGGDSAWHTSPHEEAAAVSPRSRVRPPALHLPAGADRGSAGGVYGDATAAQQQQLQQQLAHDYYHHQQQHQHQQHEQQQQEQYALYQQHQQQQQQQQWATGSPARDLGSVQYNSAGGLPYAPAAAGSGGGTGRAEFYAAECDRRATADSTQLQRQLLQQQVQAPPPYQAQQQQQCEHAQRGWQHPQQQQQQYPEAWTAAGSSGGSDVGNLIAALQRTTGRLGAAESMHRLNAAANAAANASIGGQSFAMGLPGSSTPSRRSLAGLGHSAGWLAPDATAAAGGGSEQPCGSYSSSSTAGAAGSNGGSIETLLQSLRRLSDRTAAAASGAEAAGAATCAFPATAVAPPPPQQPVDGSPSLVGVRQRLSFRSGLDMDHAPGQRSATNLQDRYQQQQQQREDGQAAEPLYWGSDGGHGSSALVSANTTAGGAEPGSATRGRFRPPSPLDLDRLLGKLHSASSAGTSSRRITAEAAAGAGRYSTGLGGFGGISSMGADGSSHPGAGEATAPVTAAAAGGVSGASGGYPSVGGAGAIGALLGMLHRATADSRRGTGDTPLGTDSSTADMPAGDPRSVRGTVESRRGTAEGAVSPGRGGTGAVAADSIGQLLGLLHRATADSRRGTAEGSAGPTSDFVSTAADEHDTVSVLGAQAVNNRRGTTEGAASASAGLSARAEDIGQLLGMLHRATAESRRGTDEASPLGGTSRRVTGESPLGMASRRGTAEPAGAEQYTPTASEAAASGSAAAAAAGYSAGPCSEVGGVNAVAEAAGVPLPLTQDGAAAGAAGHGAGNNTHAWGSGAGANNSNDGHDSIVQQQQAPYNAGSGSHSVTELIAALRRATGNSRRNTAEAHAPAAAAAGDAEAAAGGVDASPGRRDAGKGQEPHLSLKLPAIYSGSKDAEGTAQLLPTQAAAGNSSDDGSGSSDGGSSDGTTGGQSDDAASIGGLISALQCIAAASKLQEAAAIAPEVAAITQCHVAAVERQADAMQGSAYAQLVNQLSFELSELNKQELKSMQQQQQQEEGTQQQEEVAASDTAASDDADGLLTSLKAPTAAAAADNEAAAVGSMSSGSQGLQQLVAALRRVTTERARDGAATEPIEDMQQQQQEQLLLQLSQHLSLGHHQDALAGAAAAAAAGAEGRQVGSTATLGGAEGCSNSLKALLSALQATSIRHADVPTAAKAVAEAAAVPLPLSQDAAASAGGSSNGPVVQELIAYHERISTQYSGSPASANIGNRSDGGSRDGGAGSSRSSSHDVQDLIAALRRATDSKHCPEGPDAAAAAEDAADTAAAAAAGLASSAAAQPGTSNGYCSGSSVEQLLQQLAISVAKLQPPQQASDTVADTTAVATAAAGEGQLAAEGSTVALPVGLRQTAEPAPDYEVSPPASSRARRLKSPEGALPSLSAAAVSEACRTGSPVAQLTASPALDAATAATAQTSITSTDVASGRDHLRNSEGGFGELESPVATNEGDKSASVTKSVACITPSRSPGRLLAGGVQVHTSAGHLFLQLPEQNSSAAAGAAGPSPKSLEHVFALMDRASQDTPVCRSDEAMPQAKQQQQQQQQDTEAHAGAQGSTNGCQAHSTMGLDVSSLAVVFDRHVPAVLKQHLSEELAACEATVLPGVPHLGCGANMVVAEPEAAMALLPLLLDIVTPTWLAKTLKQQQHVQRDVGQAGTCAGPCPAGQRLVRLSPDVARAVGLQLQQGGTTAAAVSSEQEHSAIAPNAAGDCGGGLRVLDKWGSTLSSNGGCGMSSPKEQQQQQQQQVPVLVVPRGYAATSAGSNMPVLLQEVQGDYQQQQQAMMPAALLTDQLWSVGQHPRMVAEEELEAVVLPSSMCSTLTLLLPQSSCSLLGHAAISCAPSDPAKGLTCGDVLAAVHAFYQQEVLLQLEGQAVPPVRDTSVLQSADAVDCSGHGSGAAVQAAAGPAADVQETQEQGCGDSSSSSRLHQMVKRLQLLGHKQMCEGMFRVTRDPCSTVYEVSLA